MDFYKEHRPKVLVKFKWSKLFSCNVLKDLGEILKHRDIVQRAYQSSENWIYSLSSFKRTPHGVNELKGSIIALGYHRKVGLSDFVLLIFYVNLRISRIMLETNLGTSLKDFPYWVNWDGKTHQNCWAQKKKKGRLSIHCSLLPYCGQNVIRSLNFLLLWHLPQWSIAPLNSVIAFVTAMR